MKRVYVAGSYNAPNIVQALDNMRRGMRATVEVLLAGYAPFCPWTDHHYQLMKKENEIITREMYQAQSMAWLEVSDAVLVLPNSENSGGTQREIQRACDLGIPIFYRLVDLDEYMKSKRLK